MKKITLPILTLFISLAAMAQIPSGFDAAYLFDRGSLTNLMPEGSENLSNLTTTGSFTQVANRKGSQNQAIKIDSGSMFTTEETTTLTKRALTASYWVKMDDKTTGSARILQFYGNYSGQGATGFRMDVQYTATETILSWNGATYANGSFRGYANSNPVNNLDDGEWHHIVFRTELDGANLYVNVFVDNVRITGLDGNITTPNGVGNFITRNTFQIAPLKNYDGAIDDVRIYYSTLTDTEVGLLYNETPILILSKYFVDADATGKNDGSSWTDAYTDFRSALLNSYNNTEIWVADGIYKRSGTNRDFSFAWVADSVSVYGGFNGTETMLSQRDWRVNKTILSGDIGTVGDNSDNTYTTLIGPIGSATNTINYSLIDGFIVQDGNANGNTYYTRERGGGFFSYEYVVKTDIKNCEFKNNFGVYGGAVASIAIQNNKSVNFESCIFEDNTSTYGTIYTGGISTHDIASSMTNCLITGNTTNSPSSGADQLSSMYINLQSGSNGDIDIINSTFTSNENSYVGENETATILVYSQSTSGNKTLNIDNSIFWGNDDEELLRKYSSGNSFTSVSVKNSISDASSTETFYTETNVLNQDPLFTDASSAEYTLKTGSPAIDAGSRTGLSIPYRDLAGNIRKQGIQIDMGCYESVGAVSVKGVATQQVSVYPNPTTGLLHIQNEQPIDQVTVTDITGKILINTKTQNSTLDVSQLPTGVYILKVIENGSLATARFIKQ